MKCPYCNEEMEKGYIRSSHYMFWGKEKELGLDVNDIRLSHRSVKEFAKGFFKGFFVESYHCGKCNKIIVSLDEK